MKKILLIGIMILALVGCSPEALDYYQTATEKTESLTLGKSKTSLALNIEFDESIGEDIKAFDTFTYTSDSQFDRDEDKKIVHQHLSTLALGVDSVYYKDQLVEFVKMPFVGKYLDLNDVTFDTFDMSAYQEIPFTEASINKMIIAWKTLVEADDVVDLGNEVIDTPEGEVKVKKLVITFTHDQMKTFLNDMLLIVEEDTLFQEKIQTYPGINISEEGIEQVEQVYDVDVTMVVDQFKRLLDQIVIDEFVLTTYIDIDAYIIESQYDISLSFVGELGDYIDRIEFDGKYELYDLHEDNTFVFPSLTEENMTTLEELMNMLDQ